MIVRLRRAGGTAADGHRDAVPPWVRAGRIQTRQAGLPCPTGGKVTDETRPGARSVLGEGLRVDDRGGMAACGRTRSDRPARPGDAGPRATMRVADKPPARGLRAQARPSAPATAGSRCLSASAVGASRGRQGVAPATTTESVAGRPSPRPSPGLGSQAVERPAVRTAHSIASKTGTRRYGEAPSRPPGVDGAGATRWATSSHARSVTDA